MDLPNTHIIGVQKAATTSVFHWLSQHREVFAPLAAKDYPFFANDVRWNEGLEKYSELFKGHNGQKIVLAGSVYTYRYKYALERLHRLFPESKLILILRDPIDRMRSAYNYRVKCGAENLSFEDALIKEQERLKSQNFEEKADSGYVSNGFYYKYLKDLFSVIPRHQIKILWFDDVQHDPVGVMCSLCEFLGIQNDQSIIYKKRNVTGQVRLPWLFDFCFKDNRVRSFIVNNFIRHITTIEQRTRLRHWLKEVNTSKKAGQISSDIERTKMIDIFRDDISSLEKLLECDLSNWKN